MIKFLIDENVGYSVIKHLRDNKFDTKSISELYPARDDIFVINKAYEEDRIIVTNDKDFGYLIYKSNIQSAGVILLRFKDELSSTKINAINTVLNLPESKVINHFIVASEHKLRIRPLEMFT